MVARLFFELANPRSGSSLLWDFLNCHPKITHLFEPFQLPASSAGPVEFIEEELARCRTPVFGIGMKYFQFTQELQDYTDQHELPVLHLIRLSCQSTVASECANGTQDPPPISVCKDAFDARVEALREEISEIATWLARRSGQSFTLYYESMTNGGQDVRGFSDRRVRKDLLDFLGVDDQPLRTTRQKEHSNDIRDLVTFV